MPVATIVTVDAHIQGYNDRDDVEIDEVARRQRSRQCGYDEWCYDKDKGDENADAMVLFMLQ